jgi:uncharacterized protein (DUF2252 family)
MSHAAWDPPSDRPDPVSLLEAQARTRVPELVPIRYGRMLASPFAFYRGAAAIMAADLAHTPWCGLRAQLCGDAHLANFGLFASPERHLIFSINDFDETLPGPWEWDVKRLAVSFELGGRERGLNAKEGTDLVRAAVGSYRQAMHEFAALRELEFWYLVLDEPTIHQRWGAEARAGQMKEFDRSCAHAHTRDSLRAFAMLTRVVDGQVRMVSEPRSSSRSKSSRRQRNGSTWTQRRTPSSTPTAVPWRATVATCWSASATCIWRGRWWASGV